MPPSGAGTKGLMRLHAVAAAVVLCTGLFQYGDAHALALGRVVVQSALGEPLRAEVEVLEISAEESSSLKVGLAAAEAFRAAGMDFNAALSGLQVRLERRANGRSYLQLSGTRPVNEPFMDMILEANWATGRIVRDYTLLFDPPNLRAAAAAPLPPASGAASTSVPALPTHPPVPEAQRPPVAGSGSAPASSSARAVAPKPVPAPATETASGGARVEVKAGDTAGRIAEANRPANVSLDQMLVSMLRANPSAFIGGNVNRIKAGAVLDMPDESAASSVSASEARQIVAAQSRDFNEFRRRLAKLVPDAGVAAADRQAAGQVQAEVQDQKPAPATQDKLIVSKGAAPGQSSAEDKIAQERQAKEASTRVAELSRNIEELNKLAPADKAAAPVKAAEAPAAATPAPAATTPATAPAAPPAEPSVTPADATPPAAPPPAAAAVESPPPAPAVVAPKPVPKPAPTPAPEEPSFMGQLLDNPLVLPLAGGLLALLAGLGFYRMRQRKKTAAADSSFLESRLQPDSFFGSSGGQRIDTAEAAASGSSMVYSPSQLDAAGDVDPVAEADVYLAYGRDLQAEEILKEAMRSAPTRVAIHNKLLEIYAKRRDARAFEVVAAEAFGLTQGQGPEWEHACELGKELDPANPLYQPGGSPVAKVDNVGSGSAGGANTVPFSSSTLGQGPASGMSNAVDLDLDFSVDEPSAPAPLQTSAPDDLRVSRLDDLEQTDELTSAPSESAGPISRSMDFDLDFPSEPVPLNIDAPAVPAQQTPGAGSSTFDTLETPPSLASDDATLLNPAGDSAVVAETPAAASPELLSFDLNDIELELNTPDGESSDPSNGISAENPLETKLSLAEEFRAIGDLEGARSLAEEVLSEASGTLKAKAGTFLADLA